MFSFNRRISHDLRNYIEILGKIFIKKDLFNHLSVVFTHFVNTIRGLKRMETLKNEINKILKESFNIRGNNDFKVYFIDTYIYEDEDGELEYQEIFDGLLQQIKEDSDKFNSINTKELNLY